MKYKNHFLKEVHVIHSSEFDWFEKGNPDSPFLWHLIAAEHMEMLRAGTFRRGPFSNQQSPLDQKFCGFDGVEFSILGGFVQGKKNVQSGHWATLQTREHKVMAAKVAGAKARDTGQINSIKTYASSALGAKNQKIEDKARGGSTQGNRNVKNGHLERIRHIKNHVKRNVVFPLCRFCS
jgi:hypothetical protein